MKLTGNWRLATRPAKEPELLLWRVIVCQEAWAALTKTSRAALVALGDNPTADIHKASRTALVRHGLVDADGITLAGREVLRYRPGQETAA